MANWRSDLIRSALRYEWEPGEYLSGPAWLYPVGERSADACADDHIKHGALRAAITAELVRLMQAAY